MLVLVGRHDNGYFLPFADSWVDGAVLFVDSNHHLLGQSQNTSSVYQKNGIVSLVSIALFDSEQDQSMGTK